MQSSLQLPTYPHGRQSHAVFWRAHAEMTCYASPILHQLRVSTSKTEAEVSLEWACEGEACAGIAA